MLYVIKQQDGTYFHKDGKIILFESKSEINQFLNIFTQYSVNRLTRERRMSEAMSAPIRIMSESMAIPIDFDINKVECGTIYAKEII